MALQLPQEQLLLQQNHHYWLLQVVESYCHEYLKYVEEDTHLIQKRLNFLYMKQISKRFWSKQIDKNTLGANKNFYTIFFTVLNTNKLVFQS